MFRFLILGLLRRGETVHGYALMKAYAQRSGIQLSPSNFYRELQRLMADGLIQVAAREPTADPRRAPYKISELGAAAFDAWLCETSANSATGRDDEMSARMLFMGDADPAIAVPLLAAWRDELWTRGKTLERERETVGRQPHTRGQRFHPLPLLLARRLKHVAADLEFLEDFRLRIAATAAQPLGSRSAMPSKTPEAPAGGSPPSSVGAIASEARAIPSRSSVSHLRPNRWRR